MKKFFITMLLVILIPIIIVGVFHQIEKQNFKYVENMNVRVQRQDGKIDHVPFEQYITGVLAGEMPISFELEALKAQAVAARSYVMNKMYYNRAKNYDVVDTVMNQVYLDDAHLRAVWKESYDSKIDKINQAIKSTKGEYLEYKGKVVEAFFFSTSVGKTENSEEVFSSKLPYLRSVDSSFEDGVSPVFRETKKYSLNNFYSKLGLKNQDKITQKKTVTTSTGRVKEIIINDKKFTGSEVTKSLGLRSTFFTITQNNNEVSVTTRGYGHGVGMSQYGAQAMALMGRSYDEILKHYYLGVEIKKI